MEKLKVAEAARSILKKLVVSVFTLILSVVAFAQETKKVDINIDTNGGGGFFTQPWVWVVGVAVFILLLVALLRGGGSRRDV